MLSIEESRWPATANLRDAPTSANRTLAILLPVNTFRYLGTGATDNILRCEIGGKHQRLKRNRIYAGENRREGGEFVIGLESCFLKKRKEDTRATLPKHVKVYKNSLEKEKREGNKAEKKGEKRKGISPRGLRPTTGDDRSSFKVSAYAHTHTRARARACSRRGVVSINVKRESGHAPGRLTADVAAVMDGLQWTPPPSPAVSDHHKSSERTSPSPP